jgi:menaquinone-specific isochorismate synthase
MTVHAAPAPGLHATTRFADDADPLRALGADGCAWWHDGAGFTTSGVVARVPVGDVDAVLAAATVDDEVGMPGTGAIAVGVLPFVAGTADRWDVPARVTGRTAAGRTWVTTIGPAPGLAPVVGHDPGEFRVTRVQDRAAWRSMVERTLEEIAAGTVEKVVLARAVTVDADAPFDRAAILRRLRTNEPGCFVFASGSLLGASPELLVRRHGRAVMARPMAGTVPATDAAALAELAGSPKLAHEHRLVIEAMAQTLARGCGRVPAVSGPRPVPIGELAHLVTDLRVDLDDERDPPSALALARLLHPTPAVGGTPTAAAVRLIADLEPVARGAYAGAVGWVDGRGDGELAVALRSAQVAGSHALLHAGAGIVTGSDPDLEWAETEVKLLPMLRALVRP